MKPRTSMAPPPSTARRKSFGAGSSAIPRPGSALGDAEQESAFAHALARHHPSDYAVDSPGPSSRAALGLGPRRLPSRSATPSSPTRPRPKTPAFAPATPSSRSETPAVPTASLKEGSEVKAAGYEGILRFLGTIEGKKGTFAGVELTGASRGKGKNDGSVDGIHYFHCEPLCGLFVPEAKVQLVFQRPATPPTAGPPVLPKTMATPSRANGVAKSSAEAARAMEAKITQGSRASKYLGVTAAQLAAQRQQSTLRASSPTKRPPPSPEKKPGTPLSSSVSTPRAKPRMSGALPAPRSVSYSGRRSLGGAATPTSKSPYKRPSSVMGRDTPEVPPIPPSFMTGRATPSRRQSDIHQSNDGNPFGSPTSGPSGRPDTPARSASRASLVGRNALPPRPSSVLSQSGASSVATPEDDRDWDGLQAEKQTALKRAEDARAAQVEAEKAAKTSQARFEELRLRLESSDARVKELEMLAITATKKAEDEASRAQTASDARLQELEQRLASAEAAKATAEQAQVAVKRQSADDDDKVKRQLDEAAAAFAKERATLNAELDQLREAGNALCGVYEERLEAAASARRDIEEALRVTESELEMARSALGTTTALMSPKRESDSPSALAIDNETLRAEVEHLRDRVGTLEDSLEEARHNLATELQSSQRKRQETGDAATAVKNEVKLLKERLEHSVQREARGVSRIGELEHALKESQKTLEVERAELETLRAEARTSASAETVQKQLDALRRERDAARAEAKTAQARLADAEEELRLTEELKQTEVSPLANRMGANGDLHTPTRSKNLTSPNGHDVAAMRAAHERELQARDTELQSLRSQLAAGRTRKLSDSSSTSARSLVSPSGHKDEAAIVRDQLAGLKVIVSQLTDENTALASANKQLKRELESARSGVSVNGHVNGPNDVAELRRRLEEVEKRSNREIKALNQEVADLESLVEAKIFKEDELNDENDRLHRELDRAQAAGYVASGHAPAKKTSTGSTRNGNTSVEACELCGAFDHELANCPIFGGDGEASSRTDTLFCEDCNQYGHSVDACPNALETF